MPMVSFRWQDLRLNIMHRITKNLLLDYRAQRKLALFAQLPPADTHTFNIYSMIILGSFSDYKPTTCSLTFTKGTYSIL
jgi:hypothetical protein